MLVASKFEQSAREALAKGGNSISVETYALLDSGSEITLYHESLKVSWM